MSSSAANPLADVRRAVRAGLAESRLLGARRRLVAAVSGGADSVCLLDALVAVLPGARRRVVVGHVDHQTRPESGEDAAYVRALAAGYGLDYVVIVADVPSLAARERLGFEEAARLARYHALGRLAAEQGAAAVLTGHTRDDLVETLLLHLLRGTGRRGLGGLAPTERLELAAPGRRSGGDPGAVALTVVRPLLAVSRAETAAYCAARGLRWLVDPTNADPAFLRNRIRQHLLPVVRTYNSAVDEALVRTARVLRDEEAWLEQLVRRRWSRLRDGALARPAVRLGAWRRQPPALRRRLVRLVATDAGHRELTFEAVERALAVGAAGGPPRAELGGGLVVRRDGERLIFEGGAGAET